MTVATTAIRSTRPPHAISELSEGYFSQSVPEALKLSKTMPRTMGPIDPQRAMKGNLATFFDLSAELVLKSPIIVNVVITMAELASPAKNLKIVQLARSVAN
jgi:hypothetical protein